MKTFFINKTLFLSIALLLISLGCKKYTKKQENYKITLESSTPLEEASYRISRPDKGRFVEIETVETTIAEGKLKKLSNFEYVLDTTLITNDLYGITIRYSFDIPWGENADALINSTMTRTKTSEVLFQKSFQEEHHGGFFTINL